MNSIAYLAKYNLPEGTHFTHFIEVEALGQKFGNFETTKLLPDGLEQCAVWADIMPALKAAGYKKCQPEGPWAGDKKGRYFRNTEGFIVRASLSSESKWVDREVNYGGYFPKNRQTIAAE